MGVSIRAIGINITIPDSFCLWRIWPRLRLLPRLILHVWLLRWHARLRVSELADRSRLDIRVWVGIRDRVLRRIALVPTPRVFAGIPMIHRIGSPLHSLGGDLLPSATCRHLELVSRVGEEGFIASHIGAEGQSLRKDRFGFGEKAVIRKASAPG